MHPEGSAVGTAGASGPATRPAQLQRAAGARPAAPLPQAVRQWREAAIAWVRAEDAGTAALLAARRPASGPPRVVIVGETNRGKSSLLNALIGAPGASPVDAGVATCTWLLFQHSSTPTAVGHFGNGMADITFPVERLAAFATVDGEPDNDLPPPRWIEVGLPIPLLDSVNLVDTPGVGGLVAAHAELAAEAAAGATALLFVIDASAPFSRGELDFLDLVGDRVDSVHFAVTKTDAYRGWREIVQADRELLARHVPRFTDASFHPVSSRLAEAAASQPDPNIARMVLDQSGLPALRRVLAEDVVARAHLLAEANAIRTAVTVLEGSAEQLATTRRALTAGAAQAERLKLRREELLGQRKTGGRSWQVMLRAEIQRARVELTHETAREVREAQQMFRGAIEGADNDQLKKLPFHIDAYAQAMTMRAHGRLVDAMNRIVHSVLTELFTAEELRVLAANLATRPYERLVTKAPERQSNVDDKIMSMAGAGMGFTLGSLVRMSVGAVLPSAFGVVLLPVSLVMGGAVAWFMVRSRRRVSDKQHLKQWLMEVLSEAKAQIDQNIAAQFIEADEQLTLALDDALTRQVAALDAEIKEVDGALKLDATDRATRLKAADDRRAAALALASSGEALLQRIRHTRPMTGGVLLPGGVTATTPAGRSIVVPPGLPGSPPVVAASLPSVPSAGDPGSTTPSGPAAFPDLRALLNARNQNLSPPAEPSTGPPTGPTAPDKTSVVVQGHGTASSYPPPPPPGSVPPPVVAPALPTPETALAAADPDPTRQYSDPQPFPPAPFVRRRTVDREI